MNHRKAGKILLVLLLTTSMVGCSAMNLLTVAQPTRPVLNPIDRGDQVCFADEEASNLFDYILELENR